MSSLPKGWVYVLSNESIPNKIKIGMTDRDPQIRANELSGTSVPTPFVVEYSCLVECSYEIEQKVHEALDGYRVNNQREFFSCGIEDAINKIKHVLLSNDITVFYESPCNSLSDLDGIDQNWLKNQKSHPYIFSHEQEIENLKRAIDWIKYQSSMQFESILVSAARHQNKQFLDNIPYYRNQLIKYLTYILEAAPNFGLKDFFDSTLEMDIANLVEIINLKCEEKFSWYESTIGNQCKNYSPYKNHLIPEL